MNQVPSKVYYKISNGDVIIITTECQGDIETTTKEQDMKLYSVLKNVNANDVDFLTIPYGKLSSTFENVKSYLINVETKELELDYYNDEELECMKNEEIQADLLGYRISDISQYLSEQPSESISTIENFIIQTELNKVMEGMS